MMPKKRFLFHFQLKFLRQEPEILHTEPSSGLCFPKTLIINVNLHCTLCLWKTHIYFKNTKRCLLSVAGQKRTNVFLIKHLLFSVYPRFLIFNGILLWIVWSVGIVHLHFNRRWLVSKGSRSRPQISGTSILRIDSGDWQGSRSLSSARDLRQKYFITALHDYHHISGVGYPIFFPCFCRVYPCQEITDKISREPHRSYGSQAILHQHPAAASSCSSNPIQLLRGLGKNQ